MVQVIPKGDIIKVMVPALLGMIDTPNYADIEPDPEYVEQILTIMVENPYIVAIADYADTGDVRGVMLGCIAPVWYAQSLRAMQEILYVHPKYRGGTCMLRLIRAFEKECIARGADSIVLGCSSGENVERYTALMKRLGYDKFSVTFKQEL